MLTIFQIIFIIFVLFALGSVVARRKDGVLGPKATLFWLLFWCAVGLVVVWPDSVQLLAEYVGIGRGVDVVIYASIAMLFFLVFKMNVKIEGLKRDLTKVVREKTLKN